MMDLQVARDLWVVRFGEVFIAGSVMWVIKDPFWEPVRMTLANAQLLVALHDDEGTMCIAEMPKEDTCSGKQAPR